jgi:sugar phosphate isomerase/epimerase
MTALARRSFLKNACVAVGGATVFARLASTVRAAQIGGFNIGLQSYSLRGFPVDEALMICHDLGVNAVEFYGGMFNPASTPEQIAEMKEKLEGLGLMISAHGVNKFTKDHEKNKALFQFAKAAGFKNLTADPDPDSFESLDSLCKEYDVRIAIHNHGPKHRYNKVVDVLQAIEKHDERIGACADLGHYIRSGEKPEDVIHALKGRLYGIHLKDFAEMQDKTEGVILGKGHMNPELVFAALVDVKFPEDGALSLEYEENPKDPVAEIRECLEVARAAAKKVANE